MIEPLARFGYASKAFVYAVIGLLAAAAALRKGGAITDTSGALRVILSQPFGNLVLVLLGAGLCGYALWRALDALFDPERHGTGVGGLVVRIGSMFRGGIYGALGLEAFRLARGLRGSDGDETRMWTARIMDLPFGDWIIGAAGLVVIVYAASEVLGAVRSTGNESLDLASLPGRLRRPLLNVSRFGTAARATIIGALGFFLVRAAITRDPGEAHSTRESMVEMAGMFQGRWLLTLIALGLLAYAVDQGLHARCRRIRSPV